MSKDDVSQTYQTAWVVALTPDDSTPTNPPPDGHEWAGEWFPFQATDAGCWWRRPARQPRRAKLARSGERKAGKAAEVTPEARKGGSPDYD